MGITTAPQWSRALIEHGKPPTTPVAIVRRCSLPDQETILHNARRVAGRCCKRRKLRPPAVVIVGEVARERTAANWFTSRPLFGRDGARHAARASSRRSRRPLAQSRRERAVPAGDRNSPPADWSPVDAAIKRLGEFDWLVFSSSNGVHFFMQRLARAAATTCGDLAACGSPRSARPRSTRSPSFI